MRRSPLRHDLAELAWAVLLIDVIVLLTGVLMAAYVGRPAFLLATGFAVLVTLTMAVIAIGNLAVIGVLRLRDHRRRAEEI
jgi:hypothetical protein